MIIEKALDKYCMQLARTVAQDSNCRRRQVGAVIVLNGSVVITAANGTPPGITPCNEGGCERCLSDIPSGRAYDSCLCMHAEQAAIAFAAQQQLSIKGATIYCTVRPCIPCLNLCLHAGIIRIVYDENIQFVDDVEAAYKHLVCNSPISITQLEMLPNESD